PHEEDAVRAHVAGCPDCARDHAELAPVPALLGAVEDPEAVPAEPPPTLEDAVLDRFVREGARPEAGARRRRAFRWLARPLPAAALAATAAVVLTLAATGAFDRDGEGPKVYGAHLRAAAGGAPAGGGAERPYAYVHLSSLDTGTRVELKASGLAGAPGAVYELWCIYPDGSRVSGGTFRADPAGRATATMTTAARVGEYHRLAVERHAPGEPGQRVLAGDIAY
ncbi:MAG TPA: anti-sigma factor, partial [Thermoleophilaceae bacterium]